MRTRSGVRYTLDECVYILSILDQLKSLEELEDLTQRSLKGLKQKTFKTLNEEKTLQEIRLFDIQTMKDLYGMFGVEYPSSPGEAEKDIKNRIKKFEDIIVNVF